MNTKSWKSLSEYLLAQFKMLSVQQAVRSYMYYDITFFLLPAFDMRWSCGMIAGASRYQLNVHATWNINQQFLTLSSQTSIYNRHGDCASTDKSQYTIDKAYALVPPPFPAK
jgi:hypothetical protein